MLIYDKKLVITRTKTFHFHFNLTKKADKNLNHNIYHIIKHNGFLAGHRMKN